jgi:DNA-binding transcriptional MerR regulator
MDGVVVSAFTEEQAARLTGLSVAQLRYWDQTKFFVPSYADENRRVPYSRIYSFKDIAALRVIGVLRNQHNVSLQHLRDAAVELQHLSDDGWTKTTLYVLQKKIVFEEPDTGRLREIVGTQYVLPSVALGTVFADTERDVATLIQRPEDKVGQISRNRFISHNAPVVAGTRIPTAAIRRFREAGYSTDQIIAEYPDLTPKDVEAALEFEANAAAYG